MSCPVNSARAIQRSPPNKGVPYRTGDAFIIIATKSGLPPGLDDFTPSIWIGIPLDRSQRETGRYCVLRARVDCVPVVTEEQREPSVEFLDHDTVVDRESPLFTIFRGWPA